MKEENKKGMNLPNKLTVSRIILTPFCVALIMLTDFKWSAPLGALLFLIIALTDMLDGKIARKRNLITDFGKFLDPLADKFLVVGAYLALIYRADGIHELLIVILTIVTIFREFAVSSMRLIMNSKEKVVIPANIYGKVKTVMQMVFVIAYLIEPVLFDIAKNFSAVPDILYTIPPVSTISFAGTLIFTVLSGIIYLKAYFPHISADR